MSERLSERERIINKLHELLSDLPRHHKEVIADWHLAEVKQAIEEYKTIYFCTCDMGGE